MDGSATRDEQIAAMEDFLVLNNDYLKKRQDIGIPKMIATSVVDEIITNPERYKNANLFIESPAYSSPSASTPSATTTPPIATEAPPPVSAVPQAVPATEGVVVTLAMRQEGSKGDWDNIFENRMEDAIGKAIKDLKTDVVYDALADKVGQYNVGTQTYISTHEIENALSAAGFNKPELIGNGDKVLTLDEIRAALTPPSATPAKDPGRQQ